MINVGSRCPNCGATATIPNGEYSSAGHALRVIAHTAQDETLLRLIQTVFQKAINENILDKRGLENELSKAGVPNADRIVESAPSGKNLATWIMMIIALTALVLAAPRGIQDWQDVIEEVSKTYPDLRGALD